MTIRGRFAARTAALAAALIGAALAPQTSHAVMDPTVMEYRPAPSDMPADPATRPFFDAADPAAWTVYDLRPLRPLASQGRFGDLPDGLAKVIWGFDAVVVLTGSRPATMLPIRRPW